ncbi:uncharacterized protein C2845_PM06G32290 [Panicum miliaceum]|uniref:F-box domain-containing protein n=1 Tax=Panicum miliaceum TaxID=4540 RepID=A0A3L6RED6_PANMI|nr:uncharacterized protein C2845_PM06G32290 [Panicum miliaceum]
MDLHDDALGLVLERVGSHVSLIRAAAVCRRWRRAIAGAAFLRRFRSLHAPAVAGYYHNTSPWARILMGVDARASKGPVFLPSSPPVVDARHFSLDFLPDGAGSGTILDSRGSLLLVMGRRGRGLASPGMVVCEPLTRRCEIIPPPADFNGGGFLFSCLVDGYADDNEASGHISMSNFRVLCMFKRDGVMHAAMFTVGSSWSNKNIGHIAPSLQWPDFLGRAGGSWYFHVEGRILVELDGSTGDSTSSVILAIEESDQRCKYLVTEGRDGKPRFFTVFNNTMKVFAKLHSGEWALENSVLLSEATCGLPGYQPSFFIYGQEILTRGNKALHQEVDGHQ